MNRSFLVWLLVLVGFAVLTAPFFLAHMGSDVFDSVWGGHKAVELARRFENEVVREYSSMTHRSFVAPNGSFLDELPQNAPLPVVDHGESSASSSVWHNVARLDAPPAIAAAAAVTAALEESRAVASAQTSSGSQRPTSATPVAKTNTALTSSRSSPTVSNQHRFPALGPGASLHAVAAAHPNPKKQHTQDGTRGAKGTLVCNGKPVDSEVIYWRDVPGDADFESPITPHHHNHRERYLAFAYDQGGWNNIRMGIEIVLVAAHAMGRVLVAPPPQRLYLLGKRSVDPKTGKTKNAGPLGFEDFFDMDRLRQHRGLHIMSMEDFLETEAVHGKLKGGKLPPGNKTDVWGRDLWGYFEKVADQAPSWSGKFLAMPASTEHLAADGFHGQSSFFDHPDVAKRLKAFAGKRSPVYYDRQLQKAKLLYFRPGSSARLLQHHYAFTFFADRKMQSFYKRFIRDYMRYQDVIQCAGHEIVAAIRADAAAHHQNSHGAAAGNHSGAGSHAPYYALHVRRGDFQFKEVKISAEEIVKNLGVNEIIPRGAIVYVSTDDPKVGAFCSLNAPSQAEIEFMIWID